MERVTEAGAFIWFVAFCHPCYGFPYLFLSYEGVRPPALTLVGLYPFATIFHPLGASLPAASTPTLVAGFEFGTLRVLA